VSEFKPFEDKEKVCEINKERNKLIEDLQVIDMPETERMFILRKINIITDKLLKKARYGK